MTEREANRTLYQIFMEHFEALHPNDPSDPLYVPWTAENEAFTPDNLGPLGCWVRCSWRPATDTQLTQGPVAFNESAGVFMVQVFAPLNEGTDKISGLCDDVRTAMKRRRVGELRTLDASVQAVPSDGVYAMRVVTVEVRYTYTQ